MNLKSQSSKITLLIFILLGTLLACWFLGANWLIRDNAAGKVFDSTIECPKVKVALVLGTAPTNKYGNPNPYFSNRVRAAAELYWSGRVEFVLVSGDNGRKNYDEPTSMKNALVDYGIPSSRIYLDHAGFRTLDSMERARKVFGQKEVVVVSQRFHNERAIYLGEHFGMTVYGYNAQDVIMNGNFKEKPREYIARMKVFWDIFFGVGSKYLGPPVRIGPPAAEPPDPQVE